MAGSSIWAPIGEPGPPGPQGPVGPAGPPGPGLDAFAANLLNPTDPLYGVSLVGGTLRVVDNIATMLLQLKDKCQTIMTRGYYNPGDGGNGLYRLRVGDTLTVANGVTNFTAADGGRWELYQTSPPTARQAGCNGTATDTARLQALVNWALTDPTNAKTIIIDRMVNLTASIIVNRLVDTSKNEFLIIGQGTDTGFTTSVLNLKMFDSTLPMPGVDPQSEFVTFRNLTFTQNTLATHSSVMSDKFLRIRFSFCLFSGTVGLAGSPTYTQSLIVESCNIRGLWAGFWDANHGFDFHITNNVCEFITGSFIRIINGAYSVNITNNLYEGSGGSLIQAGACHSLVVACNYTEQNQLTAIDLSGSTQNFSVLVEGNIIKSTPANEANPAFFEIVWGPTSAGVSIANRQDGGRLHNVDGLVGVGGHAPRLVSLGDTATSTLYTNPARIDNGEGIWNPTSAVGAPTSIDARYQRIKNRVDIYFRFTMPNSATASPAVISGLPLAGIGNFGGAVIYTDQVGYVGMFGGTGTGAGTDGQSFVFCTQQGTPYTFAQMSNKLVIAKFTYEV